MLTRCVESLAGFADAIVTSDGPYKHYPASDNESSIHQHAALASAARLAQLPQTLITPSRNPVTQTEKRTRLYRAAAKLAGPSGWVLIIDADEQIEGLTQAARDMLDATDADAALVTVETGTAHAAHPRLIRALPDLTCGPQYHGMLSATDTEGRRVCIRDRRELIMRESPRPRRTKELDLSDLLTIHNDTDNRPEARKAAKREYVRRRMTDGIDL